MVRREATQDFYRIQSAAAAKGKGVPVRSPADDSWLIGLPCGGYKAIYDPDVGTGTCTVLQLTANLVLVLYDLQLHKPLFGHIIPRPSKNSLSIAVDINSSMSRATVIGKNYQINIKDEVSRILLINTSKSRDTPVYMKPDQRIQSVNLVIFNDDNLGEFSACMSIAEKIGQSCDYNGVIGRMALASTDMVQIARQMLRNPYKGRMQETYLRAKAVELMCMLHDMGNADEAHYSEIVEEVLNKLDYSLSDPVSLEELARSVRVSVSTLLRVFKMETGQTIGEYQRQRKLQEASQLLISTDKSISEVALQVGFSETASFTRAFRKNYSASPKDYRRRYKA